MAKTSGLRLAVHAMATGVALAAGAYGIYAAVVWRRYGRLPEPRADEQDELLDRYIPRYDVVERHNVRVAAPPDVTLEAAEEQDLLDSTLIRTIFKAREVVLGASPDERERPRGLLATMRALGWGVLADVPGHEIVIGAVTKPWEADVTFRGLPPDEFAAFSEPGFVKIVWTLRADRVGNDESVFRTETRAVATDATARERFRLYWAFASPGIALIRRLLLSPLRREAERRASAARCAAVPSGTTG
jgi:hypothetical protein